VSCGRDQVGGGVVDDAKGTPREGGLDAGKEDGEEYGGKELHFLSRLLGLSSSNELFWMGTVDC